MKSYRIKRIGAGSVFKFNVCVGFVVGLIASAALLIVGYTVKDLGIELGTFTNALGAGAGVVGAVLMSVFYGLIVGTAGAVIALLYNFFAAAVGGIVIKLDDGE
ncbi:MAG: hypothetical protein ACM3ZC_09000 [Bacteroidota bacterium]